MFSGGALYIHSQVIGMSMNILAFMPFGNIGQKMGRIKSKLFVDLHTASNLLQK